MSPPQPLLVLDSRERYRPVGVEVSLVATVGASWQWSRDRLDFPKETETQPNRYRGLPHAVYHRVVRDAASPLWWHQFWTWWLYNPGPPILRGVGRHEGDWELVQVGCVDEAGGQPVLVTTSQHKQGGKREAWACNRDKDGRIVIYVALGSHAGFFTRGGHGQDVCDGNGPRLLPPLKPFGDWRSWKGRWGNSDNSPKSPGRQGARWSQPSLFHSAAR